MRCNLVFKFYFHHNMRSELDHHDSLESRLTHYLTYLTAGTEIDTLHLAHIFDTSQHGVTNLLQQLPGLVNAPDRKGGPYVAIGDPSYPVEDESIVESKAKNPRIKIPPGRQIHSRKHLTE